MQTAVHPLSVAILARCTARARKARWVASPAREGPVRRPADSALHANRWRSPARPYVHVQQRDCLIWYSPRYAAVASRIVRWR